MPVEAHAGAFAAMRRRYMLYAGADDRHRSPSLVLMF